MTIADTRRAAARLRPAAALCSALAAAAGGVPAAADSIDGTVNPASAMRVSIVQLALSGLGVASAKTFRVSEFGYTRTFNASSTNCGTGERAIARFSPAATAGPAATFTVTPLHPGSCTITVGDDGSGSVRITVTVSAAPARPMSR